MRSAIFSASPSSWVVSSTQTPRSRSPAMTAAHGEAALGVDAGRGLVEEGDLGPSDQGQRQRQSLLLAAREVAARAWPATAREAHQVEQVVRSAAGSG